MSETYLHPVYWLMYTTNKVGVNNTRISWRNAVSRGQDESYTEVCLHSLPARRANINCIDLKIIINRSFCTGQGLLWRGLEVLTHHTGLHSFSTSRRAYISTKTVWYSQSTYITYNVVTIHYSERGLMLDSFNWNFPIATFLPVKSGFKWNIL